MSKLVFSSKISKLGINPYVDVPDNVLKELFKQAGKEKGPIPAQGKLNGKKFMPKLFVQNQLI